MDFEIFSQIWDRTLGQTMEISEKEAMMTNGLRAETSEKFRNAATISDEEIWEQLQAGEL